MTEWTIEVLSDQTEGVSGLLHGHREIDGKNDTRNGLTGVTGVTA